MPVNLTDNNLQASFLMDFLISESFLGFISGIIGFYDQKFRIYLFPCVVVCFVFFALVC